MGVGAGLYVYVVVVQKFTFVTSSPDKFLLYAVMVCKVPVFWHITRARTSLNAALPGPIVICAVTYLPNRSTEQNAHLYTV